MSEAIRDLVRAYARAWEESDRAAWLATFADDATQEDPIGEGVRRGREAIGAFWDNGMTTRDAIEIRPRAIHVAGGEAALEWTIVARNGDTFTTFDGVDIFTFTEEPRVKSVRAYWSRDTFDTVRPGWGVRHPGVADVLRDASRVASDDVVFGVTRLRRTAYRELDPPPDDLILSVRCIVRVADKFVVCTNVDGASHPWPGGRREPGESFAQTARREVHEETGWYVDVESLVHIGWLHYEHLSPMAQREFPWPDFFQIVFVGNAVTRDGDDTWTDTQGYEASSRLLPFDETYAAIDGDGLARVFLDALVD